MLRSISAPYIYTHMCMNKHHRLNQGFCIGGRISCKPNTGALLSTSINKNDDSKSRNCCALLGTRTRNDNDSKRIGAGMDILALPLAVVMVTFIIQLVMYVTMTARMVLITMIRIRTVKLVRVVITPTVIQIVVIMTVIMIVILIVLVTVIGLNLMLVKRMKIVIVVLAALILVAMRTTIIICSNNIITVIVVVALLRSLLLTQILEIMEAVMVAIIGLVLTPTLKNCE